MSEHQNKKTVTLHKGQQLQVVLHSTYWQFQQVSNRAVLRPEGKPVVRPKLSGCVPGQGCGTVTVLYRATASGSALVSAKRSSCGEAMGCSVSNGNFAVRVVVRR